jgi:NADP-dependent 3-hydroxy acid dehydrogenase YdfG
MASQILNNAPSPTASSSVKYAPGTSAQALASIPLWDTSKLVQDLNAVSPQQTADQGDSAAALRLYAEDVKKAVPFYHELGCRMVSPYMPRAGSLQRAKGELAPQNVVIVGGAGGMGAAVALHAARHGCFVSLIDIPDAQGNPTAALKDLAVQCRALSSADKVQIFAIYATDGAAMHTAMQQAAKFGGGAIDLLSHSAGLFGSKRSFEITQKHLGLLMDVNVRSTLVSVQAALPYLLESRNPSYIFVSSMAATEFVDNQAEYCFTKHHQSEAMNTLGHLMSHHLRIKVTELRFGHVFTSMCLGRGLPEEKMIQVNDVADLVWNIAKVPTQMRFKAVEVTPSERLEGQVMWPDAELLKLEKTRQRSG